MPAQHRPDPPAPAVAIERAVAPSNPAPAEEPRADTIALAPASSGPAVVASLEAPTVQPRSPEPSAPPEAGPKGALETTAATPLDCVAGELRTVLADVAARFGAVSVVSTHRLNSDNHTPGTIRHRLHTACKAVDFRTPGKLNEVLAFLRSRPEVSGINSYRGGLIHIDLNANIHAAGLRTRPSPRPTRSHPVSPPPGRRHAGRRRTPSPQPEERQHGDHNDDQPDDVDDVVHGDLSR
jgi:hypothetical protein